MQMPERNVQGRKWREIREQLRDRILSGIENGRLSPGDRLPSYREVAREAGLDTRAVMRIYQTLSDEGWVEVRGRSGVFVAAPNEHSVAILPPSAAFIAELFVEAHRRGVPVPRVPDLLHSASASTPVRCAVIESGDDHLQWLCGEVRRLGFDPVPIDPATAVNRRGLPPLSACDGVVTTATFAQWAREQSGEDARRTMVVKPDLQVIARMRELIVRSPLTVVCLDAGFVDRLIRVLDCEPRHPIELVRATDSDAIVRLRAASPALCTPAARELLGEPAAQGQLPDWPTLADESVRDLIQLLVALNLKALRR